MIRRIALTVAFGLAVPAAALACSDKHEQANTPTTTDGQAVLVAQADTTKPPAKKSPKKGKKKSGTGSTSKTPPK